MLSFALRLYNLAYPLQKQKPLALADLSCKMIYCTRQ